MSRKIIRNKLGLVETMKKRLRALEAKVAQEGIVLTETQLAALEKAKADKEAHGELESECPGLLRGAGRLLRGDAEGRGPHTSSPSSTPRRRWGSRSSMTARPRSPQRIC
jgi:hypothetical protein